MELLINVNLMLVIILFLVTGISLGLFAGKISTLLKMNEGMFTLFIYSFLFMLAISIGVDDLVVMSLDNIGWIAFFGIVGTVATCAVFGWFLYKNVFKKYKGRLFS